MKRLSKNDILSLKPGELFWLWVEFWRVADAQHENVKFDDQLVWAGIHQVGTSLRDDKIYFQNPSSLLSQFPWPTMRKSDIQKNGEIVVWNRVEVREIGGVVIWYDVVRIFN